MTFANNITAAPRRHIRSRLIYLVPLAVALILGTFLGVALKGDPSKIPSALIGKPVPVFSLPPVKGRLAGLSNADLQGQVALVNVFASWCAACRAEHPVLVDLATRNEVAIYGLNYKDKPDDAAAWLDTLGDPYDRTGADIDGRVAIDWGVYGVPETFVVRADGKIVMKHVGPLTQTDIEDTILPLVHKLQPGQRQSDKRQAKR
jgi:cytochrome c biogenesis protein CcmG/thiol:disulfide interchange protein DsbE